VTKQQNLAYRAPTWSEAAPCARGTAAAAAAAAGSHEHPRTSVFFRAMLTGLTAYYDLKVANC
jgi:hypothetical protein